MRSYIDSWHLSDDARVRRGGSRKRKRPPFYLTKKKCEWQFFENRFVRTAFYYLMVGLLLEMFSTRRRQQSHVEMSESTIGDIGSAIVEIVVGVAIAIKCQGDEEKDL